MPAAKKSPTKKKKTLPLPTLEFELGAGFPSRLIVGVDEVGRGCLAGPVVAGAVVLPAEWSSVPLEELRKAHEPLQFITDSKLVPEESRPELAAWIRTNVRAFGLGWASVEEIDSINIFHASFLAMKRAIAELEQGAGLKVEHILVDGNSTIAEWRRHSTPVVKGDLKSLSIACAAILAKVHRDQWMARLAEEHPGFGFETHKGYAVPSHYRLVQERGPSPIHRRSFSPIKEMLAGAERSVQNSFDFESFSEDEE